MKDREELRMIPNFWAERIELLVLSFTIMSKVKEEEVWIEKKNKIPFGMEWERMRHPSEAEYDLFNTHSNLFLEAFL